MTSCCSATDRACSPRADITRASPAKGCTCRNSCSGSGEFVQRFLEKALGSVLVPTVVSAEAEPAEREPCTATVAGPTELLDCLPTEPLGRIEIALPVREACGDTQRRRARRLRPVGCLGEHGIQTRSALAKIAASNPGQEQLGS